MKMEKICNYCKKKYNAPRSRNIRFCSKSCSSDWRKGKTVHELYGEKAQNILKILLRKDRRRKKGEYHPTEETKKKISQSKKGQPSPRIGMKLSNRIKRKISKNRSGKQAWNKGLRSSQDTRLKQRVARIKYIEKVHHPGKRLQPTIGINEKHALDVLEDCLTYTILRQYKVGGYFLDGYCSALNLAIEIDEKGHRYKVKKDEERQAFIEQQLGCSFLRINEITVTET